MQFCNACSTILQFAASLLLVLSMEAIAMDSDCDSIVSWTPSAQSAAIDGDSIVNSWTPSAQSAAIDGDSIVNSWTPSAQSAASDGDSIVSWTPSAQSAASDGDSIVSWTPSAQSAASSPCSIVPWTPPVRQEAGTSIVNGDNSPQSAWSESDGPTPKAIACNEVGNCPTTPTRSKKITLPSKLMQTTMATTAKKIQFSHNTVVDDDHRKGMKL